MELRNLEKNILYRICEELARREPCGAVETRLIYRSYADLPADKVAANIRALVTRGWLREDRNRLYLTDSGRSGIRAFIPAPLLPACDPSQDCSAS